MKLLLLIEPDNILSNSLSKALVSAGYRVNIAGNAQAAINSVDSSRPDLVILELQLIGHSGIEFLYEFRSYKDWQDVPLIILSNVPKKEFKDNDALLSSELGVVEYLYKPDTDLKKIIKMAEKVFKSE